MNNDSLLDPRVIRMPDFAGGVWLNTDQPLTKDSLYGRVVLVDFWDYTCVNCLRTLPYMAHWHARYADKGLTVIGVHSPEFAFAHHRAEIEAAMSQFDLRYAVLLDNEYQTWERFANRAWPTKYLIDHAGYLRFKRQGEGYYEETERAIQAALRLRDPLVDLPDPLPPLRPEDTPGAICFRPTPELHIGSDRGALGNREGYAADTPIAYRMPLPLEQHETHFYADGLWRATQESLIFVGQDGGRIALPYRAASVNAVLSPSGDPVDIMLNLRPTATPPFIEVRQDGRWLTPLNAGTDIEYDDGGLSYVEVTRPRMVELVRNPDFESHDVELIFHAHGLALYAFSFSSCIIPGAGNSRPDTLDTYRVG